MIQKVENLGEDANGCEFHHQDGDFVQYDEFQHKDDQFSQHDEYRHQDDGFAQHDEFQHQDSGFSQFSHFLEFDEMAKVVAVEDVSAAEVAGVIENEWKIKRSKKRKRRGNTKASMPISLLYDYQVDHFSVSKVQKHKEQQEGMHAN